MLRAAIPRSQGETARFGVNAQATSELQLVVERLLDASAQFFMSQELAAVELVQTLFYLLPEPYIVVNVVFD